jgi:putative membrane protein insertion efficiency factor
MERAATIEAERASPAKLEAAERARRSRRARTLAVLVALAVVSGVDLAQPPGRQVSARALLGAIHLYQATLSPRMPLLGVQCRFKPTCSHYAEGAIRKYGAAVGTARAIARIARCGPWTPLGTFDPP